MGRTVAGKVLVVAGVIGVTMLGNLRLQASEVSTPQPRDHSVPRVSLPDSSRPTMASADEAVVDATFEASAATDAADGADDVRLVPAIYAWDPDVRFVFFRHVSKWM